MYYYNLISKCDSLMLVVAYNFVVLIKSYVEIIFS